MFCYTGYRCYSNADLFISNLKGFIALKLFIVFEMFSEASLKANLAKKMTGLFKVSVLLMFATFYTVFLKMRFRGFACTLSVISLDPFEINSWNFQEMFVIQCSMKWMEKIVKILFSWFYKWKKDFFWLFYPLERNFNFFFHSFQRSIIYNASFKKSHLYHKYLAWKDWHKKIQVFYPLDGSNPNIWLFWIFLTSFTLSFIVLYMWKVL